MTPPRDAEARQNMASDPAISTWLPTGASANASTRRHSDGGCSRGSAATSTTLSGCGHARPEYSRSDQQFWSGTVLGLLRSSSCINRGCVC